MRHRPFIVLAAGLAGLVAVAPVLAAEDTAPTPQPGPAATSSSSSTMPGATPTSATTATTAPMEDDEASDPSADADADTGASDPTTEPDASDPTTDDEASDPTMDNDASDPATDDDAADPTAGDDAADPTTEPDASDPAAEDDEAAPSEACSEPEMQEIPAPEPGTSETFDAGVAGVVEIERTSANELHIISATPNDGWTEKIATASGPRVKGKFINNTDPNQVVRFAASLNSDGTVLRMKVTDCG